MSGFHCIFGENLKILPLVLFRYPAAGSVVHHAMVFEAAKRLFGRQSKPVPAGDDNVWMYWEGEMPPYVQMCIESVKRNAGLNVIVVERKTVCDYLPRVRSDIWSIRETAHRADYIRGSLLREHGGIWVDADFICLQSLKPLLSHLNIVGLSCSGVSPGLPSIWFLASQKGGPQMAEWVAAMDEILNRNGADAEIGWNDLGSKALSQVVAKTGYCHLERELFGWLPWQLSSDVLKFSSSAEVEAFKGYGFMLFNKMIGPTLKPMSKEQILKSDTLLGSLFRRALNWR